jgi:hypothetical protein
MSTFTHENSCSDSFLLHVLAARILQGYAKILKKPNLAMAQSLPDSLILSYKQHKSDTDLVATWLANSGEQCGFRLLTSNQTTSQAPEVLAQKKTPRLKGKARKLAKEAEKSNQPSAQSQAKIKAKTLLLKDYMPLAYRTVSFTTPAVLVPGSVVQKLEPAIHLRHSYASWLKNTAHEPLSLANNESHQYFIKILETVLEILEPLCIKAADSR